MTFLTLRSVSKSFEGHVALRDIDLDIPAGSRTVVVGPSASGKTTLLRLIAGFEVPDDGVVTLEGRVLAGDLQLVPAHRRGIGYVAQDGGLFPHLNVEQNIGFGLKLTGAARRDEILELLDMVELQPSLLQRRPDQLSGGQQQRVALARALAQQPRLILLDEPFSALDTALREATRKAVGRILSAAGITSILVTHDREEALKFADQVAILDGGSLMQAGAPRTLYAAPNSIAVATYLGDAVVLPAVVSGTSATCAYGRLRVHPTSVSGAAVVLIRPEQITLTEISSDADADDAAAEASFGEIVEADFAGAYQAVTIRPRGGDEDAGPPIVVRSAATFVATPGRLVRLDIAGDARVYPADGDDTG